MKTIKTIFLLLTIPLVLKAIPMDIRDDKPQTYAVVVGVSDFAKPGFNKLKYAHSDAYVYYQFLRSPKGGAVPEDHIKYLSNEQATREAVLGSLRNFTEQAGPEDVLIFYIATHGVPDKRTNNLYYALYDTNPNNLWGTALKKNDIIEQEQSSSAKIKLFFSDACHSGGSGVSLNTRDVSSDLINALQASQGAITEPSFSSLVATTAAEQSLEHEKWGGGHGVFTFYMIKGLEGEADKRGKYGKGNGNGIVTMRELFDYLNSALPLETPKNQQQHPVMESPNPDNIPLAAVTPTKYADAVSSSPKPKSSPITSVLAKNMAAPEVEGFGPEESFTPMSKSEAYKKLNDRFDNTFGRVVFLNHVGEGIVMYRGICVTQSAGETRAVLNIGNNRRGKTEDLYVGSRQDGGPSNPAGGSYKFYFVTSDPNQPRRYGEISLTVNAGQQTQIALDKENLLLTPGGPRESNYLRYAGFN